MPVELPVLNQLFPNNESFQETVMGRFFFSFFIARNKFFISGSVRRPREVMERLGCGGTHGRSMTQVCYVFQVTGGEKRLLKSWIRGKQEWGDRSGLPKVPASDGEMYW